jgi:hypothetical protein
MYFVRISHRDMFFFFQSLRRIDILLKVSGGIHEPNSDKLTEVFKGQLGHRRPEPEPVPISAVTQAGGLCKGTSARASYKTGTKIRR